MARSDVLVSTEWAEQNLNADKTVFVEVDEDTSAYDGGHIAGAAADPVDHDTGGYGSRIRCGSRRELTGRALAGRAPGELVR